LQRLTKDWTCRDKPKSLANEKRISHGSGRASQLPRSSAGALEQMGEFPLGAKQIAACFCLHG
jgi:hypothetical protein